MQSGGYLSLEQEIRYPGLELLDDFCYLGNCVSHRELGKECQAVHGFVDGMNFCFCSIPFSASMLMVVHVTRQISHFSSPLKLLLGT